MSDNGDRPGLFIATGEREMTRVSYQLADLAVTIRRLIKECGWEPRGDAIRHTDGLWFVQAQPAGKDGPLLGFSGTFDELVYFCGHSLKPYSMRGGTASIINPPQPAEEEDRVSRTRA